LSAAKPLCGAAAVPPDAERRRFLAYLATGALATAVHYAALVVAVE